MGFFFLFRFYGLNVTKVFRDLGLSFWGLGCRVRALGIAFAGFAGSSSVWSDIIMVE